jgi:SAM-dependent methyltransferase
MASEFLKKAVPERMRRAVHNVRQSASFARGLVWGRWAAGVDGPAGADVERPPTGRLERYFDEIREGRGIWKWRQYFDAYERHLSKFVGHAPTLLEIGIYSGGSLGMWRDYFGHGARIIGLDIEPATKCYEDEATEVLIGDQSDRAFWARFRQDVPSLDIVIDDGGHAPHQQLATLEELLPHLRPGGVFICEDIHGANNTFGAYVAGLVQNLNTMTVESLRGNFENGVMSRATPFQRAIHSVHHYPYMVVIEKNVVPVEFLLSEKHGTSWQPFGMEPKGIGTSAPR